MQSKSRVLALATATTALLLLNLPAHAGETYTETIERWRTNREERLKSDTGWLTVAGLFWLEEGENTIGSDPENDIVLPEESAPARVGVITYRDGKASIRVNEGVAVTLEGQAVTERELRDDLQETTDILEIGDVRFYVITRSDRSGIRVKDLNSRYRREFTGLHWYPIQEAYRVSARFVAYNEPIERGIPTVLGTVEKMSSPGYAVWEHEGKEVQLEPVLSGSDQLFFIFKDRTSEDETYPAGRFLYSDLPQEGMVILDFNKAYNPPCAFTPYATCPLPPARNRLEVRLEAGEKNYGKH